MRIARFSSGEDPTYGLVLGDLDEYGGLPDDAEVVSLAGDPLYSGIQPVLAGERPVTHRLADVRLLAPVIPRSKVVAIGRNYAAHAAEMGSEPPAEPMLFLKPNTAVIGPGDTIAKPAQTDDLQYEGELAVVIGRICRDVPADQAAEVIWGYTIGNDVTARDIQRATQRYSHAKGFDTFCPLGPWVDTEFDVADKRVRTFLNGDVVQDGTTADMVFDVPTLIAAVSAVMTLLPGDVILTGTPEGVGPMQPGDEVEVFIEGLGALTNKVGER